MACSRQVRHINIFGLVLRNSVFFLALSVSLCLLYIYYISSEKTSFAFASVSASKGPIITTSLLTIEDVDKLFAKSNGFLAATRTNHGKTSPSSAVCAIDPTITDCADGVGFAAFLLSTLDYINRCRALGSDRPVVFWRACNSACSRDRKVNSWHWYFEPVNHGLETQVERVLCPFFKDSYEGNAHLSAILDNSFKNRSQLEGYEDSQIITAKERMRINKLIKQYVKPNSRITDKVSKFYHRYLAGYTVLGVQVRGTDHWMETIEQRLPPLMSWVKSARAILEKLPQPRKIFIASDNDEVIKKFVTFFGNQTVSFFNLFPLFFNIFVDLPQLNASSAMSPFNFQFRIIAGQKMKLTLFYTF